MPPLKECPKSTIERHAKELSKKLWQGNKYRYTLANVVKLLNQLSGYDEAPHINVKWGHALLSVIAMESIFKQMGVRGTDKQQQAKQCMAAAMLYMQGDTIVNKKLIDEILPHEDEHARNDWIDKCVMRRKLFRLFDEPEFFVDDGQIYSRPSWYCCSHLYVVIFQPITSYLQFFCLHRNTRFINTEY